MTFRWSLNESGRVRCPLVHQYPIRVQRPQFKTMVHVTRHPSNRRARPTKPIPQLRMHRLPAIQIPHHQLHPRDRLHLQVQRTIQQKSMATIIHRGSPVSKSCPRTIRSSQKCLRKRWEQGGSNPRVSCFRRFHWVRSSAFPCSLFALSLWSLDLWHIADLLPALCFCITTWLSYIHKLYPTYHGQIASTTRDKAQCCILHSLPP